MPFVKLDCGILDSTLWVDRDAREVFITALLMASPIELQEPAQQIEVQSLNETGFTIPPGWYGLVHAAGIGIVRRSGLTDEAGMNALIRLGNPEAESRSPEFEGRRLARINGGFLVLNFQKYRDRDYTAADRAKRYRQRKATNQADLLQRDESDVTRDITQAEAEAEFRRNKQGREKGTRVPDPFPISAELRSWATKEHPELNIDAATKEFVDYWKGVSGTKGVKLDWEATWRNGMRKQDEWGKFRKAPTNHRVIDESRPWLRDDTRET